MSYLVKFCSPFSIAITSLGEARANLSAFSYVSSICACLDLSVSSSSWCLGRAAVCDCGTPWTFLTFFESYLVRNPEDSCFFFFFFFARATRLPNLINGLTHENKVLIVLRKIILQTCIRSHPVGLDV